MGGRRAQPGLPDRCRGCSWSGSRRRSSSRTPITCRARVRELAAATPELRVVVLDGHAVPSLDVTAASMLVQLREDVQHLGGELVLAENIGQVRDVLAAAEPAGEPPVRSTIEEAISAAADPRGRSPRTGEPRGAAPGERGRSTRPEGSNLMAQATLTVWKFDTAEGADEAAATLEELARAERRHPGRRRDRRLAGGEEEAQDPPARSMTGAGALGGAFWGMLFGLIFFVPLLGAAVGAATGALTGSMADVGHRRRLHQQDPRPDHAGHVGAVPDDQRRRGRQGPGRVRRRTARPS